MTHICFDYSDYEGNNLKGKSYRELSGNGAITPKTEVLFYKCKASIKIIRFYGGHVSILLSQTITVLL